MSRDQRMNDNWSLLYTRELAKKENLNFAVVFCLTDSFLEAGLRQYHFMLKGLEQLSSDLQEKNIPFYLLTGYPVDQLSRFIKKFKISHVVTDFDPLRIKQKWQKKLIEETGIELIEVDTHNIVPARIASPKQEYAAYTFRPKIKKLLHQYLNDFSSIESQKKTKPFSLQQHQWAKVLKDLKVNKIPAPVEWITPGEKAAGEKLSDFIQNKISHYSEFSNNPARDVQSNLSPYLHFGHISSQRIVIEILKSHGENKLTEDFLEQLIVRKELSDNYCLYNKNYDNMDGIPDWAFQTLDNHKKDKREYVYDPEVLESSKTHDPLWNAAQNEMKISGKMHGYLRMYWAKKILEWSENPETALKTSIFLNDKYELDGRDPNGYVGCQWSIGGLHDRPWQERDIFGKIRYMNYNGAKRKFNIEKYIQKWDKANLK